jgi:hypothetical protein
MEKTRIKKPIKSKDTVVHKACLVVLNRGPASLSNHPRELVFPANVGTLSIWQKPRTNAHKISQKCKFIQINLHHSKAAMALLCLKLATGEIDIVLIQEPWVYGDRIRGLRNIRGTSFSAGPGIAPKSWIFSGTQFITFHSQSSVLGMWQRWGWSILAEGARGNLLLPQHTSPMIQMNHPHQGLRKVIDYCRRNKLQLIIGCDANAHHIIWGSTAINPRGQCLMEYLVSMNLSILNKGNEPTVVISNRKEVIDFTR